MPEILLMPVQATAAYRCDACKKGMLENIDTEFQKEDGIKHKCPKCGNIQKLERIYPCQVNVTLKDED